MGTKRRIFRLMWNKDSYSWCVWHPDKWVLMDWPREATKKTAIKQARRAIRLRALTGEPHQLVTYNKNGRISWEATYGRDPRRHKG